MAHAWKLAATGLLGLLCGLTAQQPQRFDMKVREDFFRGIAGDHEALARGMNQCESALAENPKNAEAAAWHGSGLLTMAGRELEGGDRVRGRELLAKGLQEMNYAGALEPDNVSVLITRGSVLLRISRLLPPAEAKPMVDLGVSDYARTLNLQNSYFKYLGTHARGELLFGLAEGHQRLGEDAAARGFFERIQAQLPNSPYAKRADLWLRTKSLPANETGCVGCHSAGK